MDMVKFATNGSTVTTAAVKLARAYTGKKLVVRCADHPFFSYDDWFIGDTVMNRGVPKEISQLTKNFRFNDIDSLKKVFQENKDRIACVITEPTSHIEPKENFLNEVEELTHKHGAVLISDEISCSLRVDYATYQHYNFTPDLVTVGKAIANGYAVDALMGRKEIMGLGGIIHDQERVFLISTTFGATMSGLGAMMATLDCYKKNNVLRYLWKYNEQLMKNGNKIADQLGIRNRFYFEGFPGRMNFVTKDKNGNHSNAFRTLFLQEMIKNKVLIPWIANSYSHQKVELEMTLDAIRNALEIYQKALQGDIRKYLESKEVKPVFRKYN
jgi:glutamate-1-semialdehyde 2,1-aminomutase